MINRARCAVFENGTLVLELSAEHFQRMFKNPRSFSMRELVGVERNKRLLADYRAILTSVGCEIVGEPTYLEMARTLYRWFERDLSNFSKQTGKISKDAALVRSILVRATDPIELLTQELPRAHVQTKSKDNFADWLRNALADIGMAHRRLQAEIATDLGKGFGIAGGLTRIRAQLQAECTASASDLADARLKSFIVRCSDISLTDEKWLDSIGSLVVQSALDGWKDDTVNKFKQSLTELCGHYRRWMQVVMQRRKAPRAADRFVGLTITKAGGEESAIFVTTSDEAKAIAKDVLAMIAAPTNGDKALAAAALAQALLELDVAERDNQETGTKHGHGKTS